MKAIAFGGPGRMELRDMPEPQPDTGEVLIAVAYCGICGSDLHEYTSQAPSLRAAGVFQPVMGHEFTGTVAALGPAVEGLAVGDPVVVHPGAACGECWHCQRGLSNLCAQQLGTGYRRQGAYAQYTAVRADQALPLPGGSSLERAALTEPLAVALRAINRGALQPGETVFIAGGGPIGMLTLLAARRRDAGLVIVSEPAASRRELALNLGADFAVDPARSASLQAREITKGLGCDLAIEAVGIAPTMDDCLAAARRGGRVVVAGSFDQAYRIDLLSLLLQEQSIAGTFGYNAEFEEARDLIVSGAVDVAPLISRTVPLEDVPAVFQQLAADRGGYQKVLVHPA